MSMLAERQLAQAWARIDELFSSGLTNEHIQLSDLVLLVAATLADDDDLTDLAAWTGNWCRGLYNTPDGRETAEAIIADRSLQLQPVVRPWVAPVADVVGQLVRRQVLTVRPGSLLVGRGPQYLFAWQHKL